MTKKNVWLHLQFLSNCLIVVMIYFALLQNLLSKKLYLEDLQTCKHSASCVFLSKL